MIIRRLVSLEIKLMDKHNGLLIKENSCGMYGTNKILMEGDKNEISKY